MTVYALPVRRTQIDVRVLYAHWRGEDQVIAQDSAQIVLIAYEINGHHLSHEQVRLEFDIVARAYVWVPEPLPEVDLATNERNHVYYSDHMDALRSTLTPHDWLEETTDEVLVLPIARISWVERTLERWP